MSRRIPLPFDPRQPDLCWRPRPHQLPLWTYLERGGKRAIAVWHRRSGKDEVCLAWTAVAAHMRVGNYWHMLPEASQARKAIWEAVDPHRTQKRIDIAFPKEIRAKTRDSDMMIQFRNGSTWQVVGSDNYNSLVGSPPVGIVFSEWALADPNSWAYLKPIIEENAGWVLFITTSRGPNHAKRMYHAAQVDPEWYSGLLTAPDTGLMDEHTLRRIRQEYIIDFGETIGASMFEQEYMCSFEAAVLGAIYGKEMRDARTEDRITAVPYDPAHGVETWWDLGYRDSTSIWFMQRVGHALHAIDYYEANLQPLKHYADVLQRKPYTYTQHLVPHDAQKTELGTGLTLVEQAADLGLLLRPQLKQDLQAGITATRHMLPRMVFDAERCKQGLEGLVQYRYNWDERKHTLSTTPVHDWASHPADALRTGAQAASIVSIRAPRRRLKRA